jgi:hypothetical protein
MISLILKKTLKIIESKTLIDSTIYAINKIKIKTGLTTETNHLTIKNLILNLKIVTALLNPNLKIKIQSFQKCL